jgi:hypothetical protein
MVKGVALRSAAKSFEHLRGSKTFAELLDAAPKQLADELRYGTLAASRWYPIGWYRDLHTAMQKVTGEGERMIREVEREASRSDMTGVYRIAFKLLSPQTLFNMSERLFATYFDTGKVETVESREKYIRVRWSHCTGFSRTVWLGVFASCEVMLELAGAKNVRVHVLSGGGSSDDFAEAEGYWV